MLKRGRKNTLKICTHPGFDPGPLVSLPDTVTTRPRGQVTRGSKTQTYTRQCETRPLSYL